MTPGDKAHGLCATMRCNPTLANMSRWFSSVATWLEHHVISLPLYYAGPAMIVIGALDSSLLSLPEINDYLVVTRCYLHPQALIYFPLFAATGSVVGSLLLYTL